jgi:hypothetical protein
MHASGGTIAKVLPPHVLSKEYRRLGPPIAFEIDARQRRRTMNQPFALTIYGRYCAGETIEQLSANLGIPADRIERRIRAAQRVRGGTPDWLRNASPWVRMHLVYAFDPRRIN